MKIRIKQTNRVVDVADITAGEMVRDGDAVYVTEKAAKAETPKADEKAAK